MSLHFIEQATPWHIEIKFVLDPTIQQALISIQTSKQTSHCTSRLFSCLFTSFRALPDKGRLHPCTCPNVGDKTAVRSLSVVLSWRHYCWSLTIMSLHDDERRGSIIHMHGPERATCMPHVCGIALFVWVHCTGWKNVVSHPRVFSH